MLVHVVSKSCKHISRIDKQEFEKVLEMRVIVVIRVSDESKTCDKGKLGVSCSDVELGRQHLKVAL